MNTDQLISIIVKEVIKELKRTRPWESQDDDDYYEDDDDYD